jgi:hypothetical protein
VVQLVELVNIFIHKTCPTTWFWDGPMCKKKNNESCCGKFRRMPLWGIWTAKWGTKYEVRLVGQMPILDSKMGTTDIASDTTLLVSFVVNNRGWQLLLWPLSVNQRNPTAILNHLDFRLFISPKYLLKINTRKRCPFLVSISKQSKRATLRYLVAGNKPILFASLVPVCVIRSMCVLFWVCAWLAKGWLCVLPPLTQSLQQVKYDSKISRQINSKDQAPNYS